MIAGCDVGFDVAPGRWVVWDSQGFGFKMVVGVGLMDIADSTEWVFAVSTISVGMCFDRLIPYVEEGKREIFPTIRYRIFLL